MTQRQIRQPYTRAALDEALSELRVSTLKIHEPSEERLHVRLLVAADEHAAGLVRTLNARFDRPFVVIRDGSPIKVAVQLLAFMRSELAFMLEDAFGVMVYASDTREAQGKARGTKFVNFETFHRFTGGQLSVLPASDAYHEMLRSALRVRARAAQAEGTGLDALLAGQRGIVTRAELEAALEISSEDFSWLILPEGPTRGSYVFEVPFLGRPVGTIYDLIEGRLRELAPLFGLSLQGKETDVQYAVKYFLGGELGQVSVLFYHAPSRDMMSRVVLERPALSVPAARLAELLLALLHAQVR
ncbi:hypothetical protein [Deinococcus sedimenti]|nr:hypothetical protein [Deinococcus sedimenti]